MDANMDADWERSEGSIEIHDDALELLSLYLAFSISQESWGIISAIKRGRQINWREIGRCLGAFLVLTHVRHVQRLPIRFAHNP
jgi:hypothetical protein